MNAEAVVQRAGDLGITLTVKGDRIQYRPKSVAPPDFVQDLRAHKTQVMDQLCHQRGADLKSRYERLYPEDEIAEIQRRIHGTGICLTWCTVLDDFVAFHRDDVHSDKVPVGFVSYSSDRELRELFGNDKPDLSLTALRRIHAAKKTGAMVTGSRPNNPSCGRHVSDGHA